MNKIEIEKELNVLLKKGFLPSFSIPADAHAPEKRLVCCHSYRLPGISRGNWFIGVGGAN